MRVPMRINSTCGIARNRLNRFSSFVTEQQRIAAAQEHRGFRDATRYTRSVCRTRMKVIARRVADQPRPRAIAAIGSAPIRDEEEHAIRVAMHQPGTGEEVRIFAARIAHLPSGGVFLQPAESSANGWGNFVRRINQVEKIRRDGERASL